MNRAPVGGAAPTFGCVVASALRRRGGGVGLQSLDSLLRVARDSVLTFIKLLRVTTGSCTCK